jgi:hypothetical protein
MKRTEHIQKKKKEDRANAVDMAQGISRRPFTAKARVRSCGICGGQSGTGTGLFRVVWFSPVNIIPQWLSILIYHVGYEQ